MLYPCRALVLTCCLLTLALTVSSARVLSSDDAYTLLARSIQTGINQSGEKQVYDVESISRALSALSSAQSALKKIDGSAYELYQRTHKSSTTFEQDDDEDDDSSENVAGLKVKGRMSRNAARVGCIADSLFAAELCEWVTLPEFSPGANRDDGTLAKGREVVHRSTIVHQGISITVVVIHEANYNGGGGVDHGGLNDLLSFTKSDGHEGVIQEKRGRFLVVLSDQVPGSDLASVVSTLDSPPQKLSHRAELLSVCKPLYQIAGNVLDEITHIIDPSQTTNESEGGEVDEAVEVPVSNRPAIHFVGHSLAGGAAALAANILHGTLPMPNLSKSKRTRQGGGGKDRTSAHCIGCPPCVSANVPCPFVTSIVNGDDVVSRMSQASLHSLYDRTRRCMKGGFIGKRLGIMSDAVSLTVSGIGKDKKGDEKLSLPGRVFLVRPRRLGGGSSSIHEVNDGGKQSLRAAVLWQLKDILLSRSLWSHHRLEGYIETLDKVRLKGFSDDS